ncbi:hypothetical protein ACWGBH_24720 [Streptomyces massasporeus]
MVGRVCTAGLVIGVLVTGLVACTGGQDRAGDEKAGVGAAGVIKALGRHLKADRPLAGPSETERPAQDHFFESPADAHEGAYYAWAAIDLVEADFTYTCGDGKPAQGHVRTWEGTGAGFLSCSMPSDETAGRVAAQRTCPAGSKAAQGA